MQFSSPDASRVPSAQPNLEAHMIAALQEYKNIHFYLPVTFMSRLPLSGKIFTKSQYGHDFPQNSAEQASYKQTLDLDLKIMQAHSVLHTL
jgi:hypothetical protein